MNQPTQADLPEFPDTDAVGMAELVRTGQTTARELAEIAIARIEALNPTLNAVVSTRYEEAMHEIDAGLPDGPMRGVPILIKDLQTAVAGLPSTHGSALFADNIAAVDSELVRRYKRAGLVVLGMTNSPEFGLSPSTEPSLHGPTHNPRSHEHSPGGSSGGSAAAVAAGLIPVAHASDGGGSIRIPASMTGLFGLKPSRGLVPTAPQPTTLSAPASVQHALTTSVRDSAAMLDIASVRLPGTVIGTPRPAGTFLERAAQDPGTLRIAVATGFDSLPTDPDVAAALERTTSLCRELGHDVRHIPAPFDHVRAGAANAPLMGAALALQLRERETAIGRPIADHEIEPFTRILFDHYAGMPALELVGALREVQRIGWEIGELFDSYDVLLTPTLPLRVPALGLLNTSDPEAMYLHAAKYSAWTSVFNATGMPAMSIPAGLDPAGLPIGVQFAGDLGADGLLLSLAGQLESAAPWRSRV